MSLTKKLAKNLYESQTSVGWKLRSKRIAALFPLIEAAFDKYGHVSIVDIGGTKTYWRIVPGDFMDRYRVQVTIVTLPSNPIPQDDARFKFVHGDGCNLSNFGENAFHIAHSNSVIEHVGDWSRMVQFAKEISRVAPKYFVQTPNYWYPIEPHCMTPFFHWLPKPIRIWMVLHFQLGHWGKAETVDAAVRRTESARMLNKSMVRELFKDAQILTERFFLLPKSFVAIRD